MSAAAPTPSLADRLALVLDGLCRVLATRGGRDRASVPLVVLLWTRLRRTAQRFAALAARVRAGTYRPAPPRPRKPRPGRPAPPRLPRRFGWLIAAVPEAAAYGEYFRQILDDPETAALLEAAPQAGRLLRPLCQMLAVRPPPALLLGRDPARQPQAPNDPARRRPPRRSRPPRPLTAPPRLRLGSFSLRSPPIPD